LIMSWPLRVTISVSPYSWLSSQKPQFSTNDLAVD
jgi:hypothetical protein